MLERTNFAKNIESLDEVDIGSVKLSDLTMKFRTGCSKAKGFGPDRTVEYRAGITCELGNVAADVWAAVAEAVVARDLGKDVLEKTTQFVREKGDSVDTYNESSIREAALNLCTGGTTRECIQEMAATYPEVAAVLEKEFSF